MQLDEQQTLIAKYSVQEPPVKGMNKVHFVRDVAKKEYHIPLNFVVSFLSNPVISGVRSSVIGFFY